MAGKIMVVRAKGEPHHARRGEERAPIGRLEPGNARRRVTVSLDPDVQAGLDAHAAALTARDGLSLSDSSLLNTLLRRGLAAGDAACDILPHAAAPKTPQRGVFTPEKGQEDRDSADSSTVVHAAPSITNALAAIRRDLAINQRLLWLLVAATASAPKDAVYAGRKLAEARASIDDDDDDEGEDS